jgi:hydrogenase maturation protease
MNDRTPLLVLGLGNVLLTDDGAGPAAVALLRQRFQAPHGAVVLDGGTLGLALLSYVEDADRLLLVDAVMADASPGTVVRLEGDQVGPALATRLSPHQIGVADLMDGATWHGRRPPTIVLLGVVPESMELGVGLSRPVAAAMTGLVDVMVGEARRLGFAFSPVTSPAAAGGLDLGRLALGGAA